MVNEKNHFDVVLYLASCIYYDNLNKVDLELINANIKTLTQCVAQFNKAHFIYASSISVHGFANRPIITERTSFAPENAYAITKLAGEVIVQSARKFSVIRLPSLFGIGMKQNTFIPQIIKSAISKKCITLFGNGERSQNYLHYNEAAQYFLKAMLKSKSGIYLATAVRSYKNIEVAQKVASQLNDVPIVFAGIDHSNSVFCDNSTTISELNLNFEAYFETGLTELIIWMQKQYS